MFIYITIYENELKSRWFEFEFGFHNFLFSRLIRAEFKEQKTKLSVDYLYGSLIYKREFAMGSICITSFFIFFKELRSLELLALRNEVIFFLEKFMFIYSLRGRFKFIPKWERKRSKPFLSFFDLRHSLNLRCDRRYFWCVWVRVGVCARKLVTTRKFYAVI